MEIGMKNNNSELLSYVKLKFDINHPDIEQCYASGYESGMKGSDIENNPYKFDSVLAEQWDEGWWHGFYNEQPIFAIAQETPDSAPQNDSDYNSGSFFANFWKITGVIAASTFVGYQMIDLVA